MEQGKSFSTKGFGEINLRKTEDPWESPYKNEIFMFGNFSKIQCSRITLISHSFREKQSVMATH